MNKTKRWARTGLAVVFAGLIVGNSMRAEGESVTTPIVSKVTATDFFNNVIVANVQKGRDFAKKWLITKPYDLIGKNVAGGVVNKLDATLGGYPSTLWNNGPKKLWDASPQGTGYVLAVATVALVCHYLKSKVIDNTKTKIQDGDFVVSGAQSLLYESYNDPKTTDTEKEDLLQAMAVLEFQGKSFVERVRTMFCVSVPTF